VLLVAEYLDKQLIDVTGQNAGKVDGIVLEVRDGQPPKVVSIEVGPITLLARFSPRLAQWYARFDAHFGKQRGRPIRIPWSRVNKQGATLALDLRADATPIVAVENWLRDRIVARIPGAGE
jgi:sporulation protein YlmC with PRC-barrel domain